MNKLNGTTKEVYDFVVEFINVNGYSPSVREIAAAVKIKSTSTIFYHMNKLEEHGLIKKASTKNRAIGLLNKKNVPNTKEIKVVGKVSAGLPILAVENVIDTISLPETMFGNGEVFMLKVAGDSMCNAGILDKDLIVVSQQSNANNGEIVVAMIDDEVTVKRFYKEQNHIRLQPENDNYEPIISTNVRLVGKVVGLIRNI